MVKIILALAIFTLSGKAAAQTETIRDPRAWAAELPDSVWLDTPGLVRTFTIVPADKKSNGKWSELSDKFMGMGFLQYIPLDASAFSNQINNFQSGSADETAKEETYSADGSSAQLILKEEKSKFVAQSMSKGTLKTLGKWAFKNKDTKTPDAFHKWLTSKIAYDAVVLDVKDDLILAGLLGKYTDLGQGLLIKNSAKKKVLKKSKITGDALLQMLRIEGDYVVFESLLSNSKSKIVPGTKIILGQSEQLKGMMSNQGAKKSTKKLGAAEAPEKEAPEKEAPEAEAPEAAEEGEEKE